MKINPEEILLNPSYKVDKFPYFVSGNEETLIKQIEEILINKFKQKGFVEKEKIEKIENYNNSRSLFHDSKLVILTSIVNVNKLKIENIIKNGDMLIVSSANLAPAPRSSKLATFIPVCCNGNTSSILVERMSLITRSGLRFIMQSITLFGEAISK